MNLLLWGITLSTLGKLVLGIAVLRVHVYILREHSIDSVVLRALKREQYVTIAGLALIIIGFILEMGFYLHVGDLMNCGSDECLALVRNTLF